jgi:hypothetical protein
MYCEPLDNDPDVYSCLAHLPRLKDDGDDESSGDAFSRLWKLERLDHDPDVAVNYQTSSRNDAASVYTGETISELTDEFWYPDENDRDSSCFYSISENDEVNQSTGSCRADISSSSHRQDQRSRKKLFGGEESDDDEYSANKISNITSSETRIAIRQSDLSLKLSVDRLPFSSIQYRFRCNCENGNCIKDIPPSDSETFRESFWGPPGIDSYPTSALRREQFRNILEKAFVANDSNYLKKPPKTPKTPKTCIVPKQSNFFFSIGKHAVCESGLMTMLGFTKERPRMWREVKARVQNGMNEPASVAAEKTIFQSMRYHARMFMLTFIDRECDKLPDRNCSVVPYTTVSQFYADYEFLYRTQLNSGKVDTEQVASYDTFKRAFDDLAAEGKVTLMRKVGNFTTCEVCNNISDLLRNGRLVYTPMEREVFLSYRRAHLKQQSKERKAMDQVKVDCQRTGAGGQPLEVYINPDGMTERRGNTPINRTGGGRISKGSEASVTKNRVIGVEVVCGLPELGGLDGYYLYIADNFMPGGSNFLIEIVRQTLKDIAEHCASQGWTMPKTLHVQFDNCGENKNRYMFTYLSALVELDYFDKIYINFLIVGHTHNTLDQYFGTLSGVIKGTCFVGSPLALDALLTEYPNPKPIKVRRIEAVYDVRRAHWKVSIINRLSFFRLVELIHTLVHF